MALASKVKEMSAVHESHSLDEYVTKIANNNPWYVKFIYGIFGIFNIKSAMDNRMKSLIKVGRFPTIALALANHLQLSRSLMTHAIWLQFKQEVQLLL